MLPVPTPLAACTICAQQSSSKTCKQRSVALQQRKLHSTEGKWALCRKLSAGM